MLATPPCLVHVVGKRIVNAAGRVAFDSHSGPWSIVGEKAAYFTGWCPACAYGTVSLTVTLDGGRGFRRYTVPALTGFRATAIRVAGDDVMIRAASQLRRGPRVRTATVRVR